MKGKAMKKNCWEYMECGKEAMGANGKNGSACPASKMRELDSIHGGMYAGRACWVVSGTMCGGGKQGVCAEKMGRCVMCDFYKMVRSEEKNDFRLPRELIDLMLSYQ
jgi:hypothetical protein